MSFLKKIKNVLSFFSPWGSAGSKTSGRRKTAKKRTVRKKKAPAKSVRTVVKKPGKRKPAAVKTKTKTRSVPKKTASIRTRTAAKKTGVKVSPVRKPVKTAGVRLKKAPADRVMTGEVTHYFDRIKAAAFIVTGAPIALGDELEFEDKAGKTFRQEITSLQMNRKPIRSARAGDEVGMLVKKPVREGDYVFKRLR